LNKQGDLADQWVVNKEKFSLSKVLFTVGQLENYSFVDGKNSLTGKDILGDFFEQIQRGGFKQTKGQFFTPVNVVRFMLYALELDSLALELMNKENRLPYIIDPSCGSATFLIESMKLITNEVKRRRRSDLSTSRMVMQRFDELFQPDYHEHKWAREYLYGIEHNFELATASKVNMILHGDRT
jgi:type I restriction enzyme M protein